MLPRMGEEMTQDPKAPDPGSGWEHDRKTPLSRLRYTDIGVRTWRMVVAAVVILALVILVWFMLRAREPHSGTMTTPDGITHRCDPIERKSDGSIVCTVHGVTIVGPPGVTYSFDQS